ncbi:MAG: hypothetical protein A3I11_08810 [Elusimicrobia bacterium RIFCSPLOWO2_02_FULL_39_32]|nr:MAG: hypothetical protein A3B80_06620 [Elusimicrobia bacterium RIFCSPHIGHO2_02_FULL_39_36]OGR91258.1 MAG: hypothetical protein A3I11_08810 [Elusimicrobia bacterium RIFCSPLOWO2_02_FULL_39_32]OGS00632.1 MAG: hypothetical protein A3G85_02700 [Elusimicrobia bacterium RIFCSPLOWO2_12_FULL_39_28]
MKLLKVFYLISIIFFFFSFCNAEEPPSQNQPENSLLVRVTQPMEDMVTKTAHTAVEEVQAAAKEAHTLGKKFLQGLINIMIAASPGKTRVYLPAPSSDPNSGLTVGVLPVFLFVNKKEEIQHILAPSLTYNHTFGINSTMRHYWYPHKNAQMFIIASYATETNRRITFRYEDSQFLSEWFYFKCDLTVRRDGSFRFFGFGPRSEFKNQSNYTLKDNHFQIFTGINFLERLRLTLSNRYRLANALDGPIHSLPSITTFSPRPEGVDIQKAVLAQRLTLSYDSRDLILAPTRGHLFNLFEEIAGPLGGDTKYDRMGLEARGFYPLKNNQWITGWRFLVEGENGSKTPFYEQSLLGGKDSLRGFGDARFIDRNKMNLTIEERIRVYTLSAFNVNVDFELTPYYDTGMVFHDPDNGRIWDLHHVGGLGFRTVVRPNVVGIIDLGFSEQGTALFVGIDYPF